MFKGYRNLRRLLRDESGHFAVITAFVGLPLIVAVGLAVDTTNSFSHKNNMKTALDTATLASVVPAHLSDDERKDFAKQVFNGNYSAPEGVTIDVDVEASRDRVDMAAKADFPV